MRLFVTVILFFLSIALHAYNPPKLERFAQQNTSTRTEFVWVQDVAEVKDAAAALDWLKNRIPFSSDEQSLELIYTKSSPTGTHYTFQHTFLGQEVFASLAKLHTDLDGKITLYQSNIVDLNDRAVLKDNTHEGSEFTVFYDDQLALFTSMKLDKESRQESYWISGNLIYERAGKLNFVQPDTIVHAKVFLVNPVNSSGVSYGGSMVDSDDQHLPVHEAEMKWVEMQAEFQDDTFYLRSERYGFSQESNPSTPETISLVDSFVFDRSEIGFEDVNAFYHITNYSNYVESIGFSTVLPDTMNIDAHAFNGRDESAFTFNASPVYLEFGTGGVDDAEDGEVVIHEFGHAISNTASPKTVSGTERSSMEEGNADYISKSYSALYGNPFPNRVFTWDGHNEYWSGIQTNTVKFYPTHLTGRTNDDREIWSSPLFCILDKLGKEKTDSLVFSHLFYQTTNTSMPEMARTMLLVDTLLWEGQNSRDIINCFAKWNVLDSLDPSKPPIDISILRLFNSDAFAHGLGEMNCVIPGTDYKRISICNSLGQILDFKEGKISNVRFKPEDYRPGTYFITVETLDYFETLKFIKIQ